jgi:hypothetical protein
MTLGDLRQFLASIENVPDEALIRTRVTLARHMRSVTVEEEDVGFRDYVRAVTPGDGDPTGENSEQSSA